jgi:thiamine pyrophosphokinase
MRAILLGAALSVQNKKVWASILDSIKINSNDFLIGIDGGIEIWEKWGFCAHLAVGDWDSLTSKNKYLARVPHITLSRYKDRSDLFYAGIAAIEFGADKLVCLGVTGARLDHHLASLYDLSNFSRGKYGKLNQVIAVGPEAEYHFLSEKIPFWTNKNRLQPPKKDYDFRNQIVSIFPLMSSAKGVHLSGFQYPLDNVTLQPSSLGLSNQIKKRNYSVRLRKGQLVVIIPSDESTKNRSTKYGSK